MLQEFGPLPQAAKNKSDWVRFLGVVLEEQVGKNLVFGCNVLSKNRNLQ
jgi:hypothetical protein